MASETRPEKRSMTKMRVNGIFGLGGKDYPYM